MKGLIKSFGWAFSGLWYGLRTQRNLKIHALATLVAISISAYLKLTAWAWAVIFLTCALVWCAELFNTAIEVTLDHLSPEIHPQVKIAKDVAAAAVLVCAIFALLIAGCLWGAVILHAI